MRKWYANCSIEEEVGISQQALDALTLIANGYKLDGKELFVSISMDEMAIRRMVQWDSAKKQFKGYITYGEYGSNDIPVARNALVFMASCINGDFSVPIAHYFITVLKGHEKSLLISDIIEVITKLGITVANITFDGLGSNLSACEHLGACFNLLDMRPYILNPVNSTKIHIFLDACHMLKLARNCIASGKIIYERTRNSQIKWIFFERLEAARVKKGYVCHKLTKKHIQWYQSKMHVRLAAETLSDSVANAMESLMREGVKDFQGCESTIRYIRMMNKVFDIFNSKKDKDENIFKSPIKMSSKDTVIIFLDQVEDYLCSLKFDGKSVMLTRIKTAFKGTLINIISLKEIIAEYLETGRIECVPTFRMSQDLLESLFGRIRSLNGCNDNPSVEQFSSALRKLIVHNEIISSELSNCQDQLKILTISSLKKKSNEGIPNNIIIDNERDRLIVEVFCPNDVLLDFFQETSIVQTSEEIEKKIQNIARFQCESCMNVLNDHDKVSSGSHNFTPCFSTVLIGKVVQKFLNLYKNNRIGNYDLLIEVILQNIKNDLVFQNFICSADHKMHFITFIVHEFIRMRAVYVAKNDTLNEQTLMLRKKLRKYVHFHGQ